MSELRFLLARTLERTGWWAKWLGPCHACGRSRLGSRLLALIWPRPNCCVHSGGEPTDARPIFVTVSLLSNTFSRKEGSILFAMPVPTSGPGMKHTEQGSPANLQTWEKKSCWISQSSGCFTEQHLCAERRPIQRDLNRRLLRSQMKRHHCNQTSKNPLTCDSYTTHQVVSLVFALECTSFMKNPYFGIGT